MAAWDAAGQALGQPLARLLGATPRPIPAYNSKGLGIMPLKPLLKEAVELLAEGFSAVKLRLGRPDAHEDLQAIREVKKAIGPNVVLMVDFNQGLSVAEALKGPAWRCRATCFPRRAAICSPPRQPATGSSSSTGPRRFCRTRCR